jgi:release factor glutamine methyltransferase
VRSAWPATLRTDRVEPAVHRTDDVHLQQGDLRFEPRAALASGADGLDAIRLIVAAAPGHLHPQGWLLFEHGHDQGSAVRELLAQNSFVGIFTATDLEQRERVSGGRVL